jgi:hypothetical protein
VSRRYGHPLSRSIVRRSVFLARFHDPEPQGGKVLPLLPLLGFHALEVAAENERQLAKTIDQLARKQGAQESAAAKRKTAGSERKEKREGEGGGVATTS